MCIYHKSNLDKIRLDITFLKVKQYFLLHVLTKQTCWIKLIITAKSPLNAAILPEAKITLAHLAYLCFK